MNEDLPQAPNSIYSLVSNNGLDVQMTANDLLIRSSKEVKGSCSLRLIDATGKEAVVRKMNGINYKMTLRLIHPNFQVVCTSFR